jgi:uncharacterized protein (DUF433 family)
VIIKNLAFIQVEKMPIQQVSKEYIAIDADYCCGKPRIVGTRMPVAAIAKMYLEMGESLEEIALEFDLPQAAVYAAMAYYYDRQEEIDRHTAESEALVEEMKRIAVFISVRYSVKSQNL